MGLEYYVFIVLGRQDIAPGILNCITGPRGGFGLPLFLKFGIKGGIIPLLLLSNLFTPG